MWINLVPITWARDLVALIRWNLTLHQRHFHWLFSSFSMWSSYRMDDIELINSIFPECDVFRLKSRWYLDGELPNGAAMSKKYLINDEQNYREVKFCEGDLSITNKYWREKTAPWKQITVTYHYLYYLYIYIYIYRYRYRYIYIYIYICVPR